MTGCLPRFPLCLHAPVSDAAAEPEELVPPADKHGLSWSDRLWVGNCPQWSLLVCSLIHFIFI